MMSERLQSILHFTAICLFILLTGSLSARDDAKTAKTEEDGGEKTVAIRGEDGHNIRPRPANLPFDISESNRLLPLDLKDKPTGWYPVFVPVIGQDETLGTIYGVAGGMVNNGHRSNPLFEYTAFRELLMFNAVRSSRGFSAYTMIYGDQYTGDTPWSYLIMAGFIRDINALYFGVGEETMEPLGYRPRNDPAAPLLPNKTFDETQKNLAYRRPANQGRPFTTHETDQKYNRYYYEMPGGSFTVYNNALRDFSFVGCLYSARYIIKAYDNRIFRAQDPYLGDTPLREINVVLPTPNGKTKLTEDQEEGKIRGFDGGWVNTIRLGVRYDTRDLATDPTYGVLVELTHERSHPELGSDFQFNKTFFQIKGFYAPFPEVFEKLVLASRVGAVVTKGEAPFFKYPDFWVAEKGNPEWKGLGGRGTLHGFQQPRFVGPAMGFANIELRFRFASVKVGKYYMDFLIAPFYELGRVWDRYQDMNARGYVHDRGVSTRVVINKSLVLSADVAWSAEDKTFNMGAEHPF